MIKGFKILAGLLCLAVVAFAGRTIMAAAGIDFVDGTKIPRAFYGPHYYAAEDVTASFTATVDDTLWHLDTSGGAITVTLPSPATVPAGQCFEALLTTAGNAVTFTAAPYSINGAVSTNAMDAAGDSMVICSTGNTTEGYKFMARYIQ